MENIQTKNGEDDAAAGDSRIKADDSTDFVDVEGHAKVNDPVEPPARFAPKGRASLDMAIEEPVTTGGGSKQIEADSILTRLYDPDRMQKPAIWKFIKLVAPGPADQPPPGCMKWRSKDAVAAYCLKCKKQFTYTKGTSKTISRHMMAYHGLVNTDGDTDVMKASGTDSARCKIVSPSMGKEPPLKKRKKSVTKGDSQPLLLLKWLVGSFRPLSIVQDPGFKDLVRGLPETYTKEDVLALARSKVESVKAELHQQLALCDDFSLSYEIVENQGVKYCSVRITFCTVLFERHSFTIKVAPCESPASVVEEALEEYGLHSERITNITRMHANQDESLTETGAQLNIAPELASGCILNKMDHVVISHLSMDPVKQLLALIREYVKNHKLSNCKDAYAIVQEFLEIPTPATSKNGDVAYPTAQQQSMARALSEMLQPFNDATKTLSGEPYPMMAIPVFRRINDVLEKVNVNDSLGSGFEATSMEQFRQSLLAAFVRAFEPMLNGTSPFLWTVPIDPRLIHMKCLSASEKDDVVSTLTANVKRLKLSKRSNGGSVDQQGQDGAKNKRQETSTMAGIFFGEDTEVEDTDVRCSDDAASYARTSVDRYIDAVKSNRRIEDPLGWWKANREQFPEIATLARKWLGASTIFLESDSSAVRESYAVDNLEVVSFLHDNIGLI